MLKASSAVKARCSMYCSAEPRQWLGSTYATPAPKRETMRTATRATIKAWEPWMRRV
jgi:hypothetical protein